MNNRGYVFPTVLVFCLLLFMLASHQLFIYMGEKQFITSKKEDFLLESMIEKSGEEVVGQLREKKQPDRILLYKQGSVSCRINNASAPVIEINLLASLAIHQTKSAIIYYNSETKKITKWVEGAS